MTFAMQPADLLLPVFVQVALTFVLLVSTARARVGAVRARQVAVKDIALGENAWPARPTQLSRAYQNQLELPILFYTLVALVLIASRADLVLLGLAWLFVAFRAWHALIHTTHNNVIQRFRAFSFGFYTLGAMWAYFAAGIIAARFA